MAVFGLNIEEKPWYYALGVGLAVGIVLAGAVHWFWFKPMNAEIAGKKVELDGLNQEIQKGRAAERKLAQFREEVKRLELELSKLLQILPSKRNTEELIKRIETLTRQGDFTLKKFTPGDFAQKEFYAAWPIDIQVEGTYHNLALFFDRMSRFSRIVNVEDLKITALNDAAGKSIAAQFVAKTFIYTGDEVGQATATQGLATGATPPSQPAAPGAKPGAAGKAQGLKERAEGKGAE
jgi:Tfp pilus assembly protein PilO